MLKDKKSRKIGLALGGGAAKGFAHIGVLEVLEREGIPIDMICGASMGAIIGGFYAHTKNLQLIRDLADEIGRKRGYYFSDVSLPRTGLIRLGRVERLLKTVIGGVDFSDLQIPFACVAADMDSGSEVLLDHGQVWDAIRASSSIPVVISLTQLEGRNLLDGGLLDPLPVSAVRKMGADIVIAVNVSGSMDDTPSVRPNMFTIMMKTIHLVGARELALAVRQADAVIEPDLRAVGFADFQRAEDCFRLGRAAAEDALPEIRRKLANV